MRKRLAFIAVILFISITANLLGCSSANESLPIAFQPNEQNKGRQCQAVYYGLGNGDGIDDPYCYDLQKQLSKAAFEGNIEEMKILLRDGANANATVGDSLYSLEAAAINGQTQTAQLLLENGANVNHHHSIRGTPLMKAVNSGNVETVNLLLSRGADVNLVSDGYTALKLAREKKNQEITSLLQRAGAQK